MILRHSAPISIRTAVLSLILLSTITAPAFADDVQAWLTTSATGPASRDWRVSTELHGRWVNDAQDYQRTVLRLQGGRALRNRVVVWLGFENTWPAAGRTPTERRIWQQVTWTHLAGAWQLAHRGRLEERFIDGADGVVPRLRYQLRASRALDATRRWSFVASGEAFVRLRALRTASERLDAGYDRDRVSAGISRQLTPTITLEPAYALQRISLPSNDRREHILQLSVNHRF